MKLGLNIRTLKLTVVIALTAPHYRYLVICVQYRTGKILQENVPYFKFEGRQVGTVPGTIFTYCIRYSTKGSNVEMHSNLEDQLFVGTSKST